MPPLRIAEVAWDEANSEHATLRVTAAEIEQVLFDSHTVIRRNRSGRTADYLADGRTRGGRVVRIAFVYDLERLQARPITAWEVR
ncbi:MAG: hypothetical protein DLM55_02125 [Acidimicrobiales bacterium]|nr:MAG: hypothetical protein DLM55_02125 [Acidimicrobiales bacterium]